MKKTVLKDMKHQNMNMIFHLLLTEGSLSRIEIAEKTSLAPSTVGSIVREMIEEGILKEEKSTASSSGRKPVLLQINADYGLIAVYEVFRSGVTCSLFNLYLQQIERKQLSHNVPDGTELYQLVIGSINTQKHLCGIGFLFQNDMMLSDFNVLYDTGISSSLITLHDALASRYHTAVVESFTQAATVSQIIREKAADTASAEIALGKELRAAVLIDGKALNVRKELLDHLPKEADDGRTLSMLIEQICMMFAIHSVFLVSKNDISADLVEQIQSDIDSDLKTIKPRIHAIEHADQQETCWIAGKLLHSLRLAG